MVFSDLLNYSVIVMAKNKDKIPLAPNLKEDIGPIKNKLGILDYRTDEHKFAHIVINTSLCSDCPHHLCISGCPVRCFNFFKKIDGKTEMVFSYEDCIECGTCDIMCDQGAVAWTFPRGSFGIKYEQG